MLIGVILSLIPIIDLIFTHQIPQRVDSRAQKELFDNLEKLKKDEDDKKKTEDKKGVLSDRNLNLNNPKINPNTVSDLLNNQQTVINNNNLDPNNAEAQRKIDNPDLARKRTKLRRKGDPKEDN